MTTVDEDNRLKSSQVGRNRWTRVREAYRSGELDRRDLVLQSEQKRPRRNALADISAVSTTVNTTSQKHQFHQLVERVRELQNEIVPDALLYQMAQNYSPFSPVTPSSNASRGSISLYPARQSISISSGSLNSIVPNQRFSLSPRMLERAHQIPERFWLDWQQKQMQDQLEELEYIKSNMADSSNSSFLSNETDENDMDLSMLDRRKDDSEIRRRSLLFLHEAQRLAKERRVSLARQVAIDESTSKTDEKSSDHRSFNFDQRSQETADTANLNDVDENRPTEPLTQSSPVQLSPPPPPPDRSRLSMSLPFTYTNTREQKGFPNHSRQITSEPILDKMTEVNDHTIQTTSPTDSLEDVAQIDTELNLTILKREVHPKPISPLLYSKATLNRRIEFRKFIPISTRNTTMSSKKDIPIHITVLKRKEIGDSRSPSPTLSFKSVRSSFSLMDNDEELDDGNQISSVIRSLSVFSHSRSVSSPFTSTIISCGDHNNNYLLLKEKSSTKSTCSVQDQSMINVYELEQTSSVPSSCPITPSEEEEKQQDNLSFSRTLFICRHRQRRPKRKGNTLNLSFISTFSSENNRPSRRDLLHQAEEADHNYNTIKNVLKITRNTSSRKTRAWKQNGGGFQRDALTNDNSNDDEHVTRSSSSSSTAAAIDRLIRRRRRKQTRLKRKTGSEKRKEEKKTKKKKKKKKERNKKSPSSSIEAEATEASLFQFVAVDTPTIDTSAIFYPYEQTRCADKSTAKEENCFSIQTSGEHHHHLQQKQEFPSDLTMADGHGYSTPNSTRKKKENVRVFIRHRRRTSKIPQRAFRHSSSSNHSHETISSSSSSTNVKELVSLIQQQIKTKQRKSRNNKNIIIVNYKPVFLNSRQQKSSQPTKPSPVPVTKTKPFPTDDDFSSATHYSRRRSLTTTSSDGSPLRSPANRSRQEQSVSLDVPDVEDPLMFIEMMYQQLFTEDGRLRSGTEPTMLANCVKQIVTNSRRNSISSSIANGSSSSHLKPKNLNTTHQQRTLPSSAYRPLTPSKPISLSSSPRLIHAEQYDTFSEEEEEEEEPNTIVQAIKTNTDNSRRNSKRLGTENQSHIQAFLNSCQPKRLSTTTTTTTVNHGFHFSVDDTDNEDLDTFSDLNSLRFNNKTIQTSPSVEDDLTHTDSRLLSSSGYHSLDHSKKSKPFLSKSHSENDLSHLSPKTNTQIQCIHICPNCIRPLTVTVIPPLISSSNLIQRIQHPVGIMLMKYLNFILISKNVLLLPLFIFLLRQRAVHLGN